MAKHIIWVGHGDGDPGATGYYGKGERAYLLELASEMQDILNKAGMSNEVEIITDRNIYKRNELKNSPKKYKEALSNTELHLNAFNGVAYGTETIKAIGMAPDVIDKRFEAFMSKLWRWRGHKQVSHLRNPNVAKTLGLPSYRLIEYCFCDNKADIDIFIKNFKEIARGTLEAVLGKEIKEKETASEGVVNVTFSSDYIIQLGAFNNYEYAQNKLEEVKNYFPDAWVRRVR